MAGAPATTGIAFSGGGIRSAAFCLGVLCKMLQDKVPMEYLSCVSGGGYTGAAFLDWKKRKGPTDQWHGEFFENMRNNAGYLCNWQSPLRGICHSIYFTFLLIFVVIILPCVLWLPNAFPVAVFVDFCFGGILRENSTCPPSVSMGTKTSFLILDLYGDCQPPGRRVALFVTTFALWVVFLILSRIKCLIKGQNWFRFFSILSGLVLALTFFPWVTHDFLWPLRTWIKVLVFIIFLVLPFFFPIVRNFAAIFLFFYAYTLVVSWRVFKADLFGVFPYSDEVFYPVLIGCAIAGILFPVIGSIHQSLFNIYYRHRLSDAFFVKAARCRWQDVFPNCVRLAEGIYDIIRPNGKVGPLSPERNTDDELTLDDLKDVSPIFISSITVNDWQSSSDAKSSHQLISFSSKGVELIGSDWEKPSKLSECFKPKHMRLSAAMAISGAAVSYDMGRRESRLNMVLDLLNLLGIGMGDEMVSDQCHFEQQSKSTVGMMKQFVLPFLVENGFVLALPFVYWVAHNKHLVEYFVLVHILILVLLTGLAMAKTGSTDPGRWEQFVSWWIRHTFFVRFIRGFLNIHNVGTHPPPVLRLSDGGHFESLALLPLLDKKLKKIVIFDGSYNPGDAEKYADSLLTALKLAREKLHCSFQGRRNSDINEDIRVEFLKMNSEQRPRSYTFKVRYYDQSDGEIRFVAPRHPSESIPLKNQKTGQPTSYLDTERGESPELKEEDANKLTFCCCPCCHCYSSSCRFISERLLGKFPHHITANQFFTRDTFSAYDREGYAACVEAEVADFLKPRSP
ncbi:PREDICTED: uncharacterized protein LOC107327124 [Acropora digitifera]|uniref:uncharacterized protein LOC107327124 n=1 Tax=Acropora digitifera TaxID=70779 RepID=UPI00077AC3CC|nr:PREDICTED: uncharacterized protein LOC107327124 [Acropora digitifera]